MSFKHKKILNKKTRGKTYVRTLLTIRFAENPLKAIARRKTKIKVGSRNVH